MQKTIKINDGKIVFDNNLLNFSFYNKKEKFFEIDFKNKKINLNSLNKIIRKARIEITLKCNMACTYCIVYKNFIEQINTHMTLENAKKVLDKINSYKTINSLMIIGGEPLTNLESLKYLCKNFKGKKTIFTNGYLLNSELIKFFKETNSRIMISLDGKRKHNINRVDHIGQETFGIIIEKIKLIQKNNADITLNTLVTNDTVFELFDIVKYFVEDLNIKSFGLSIPHYTKENTEFAKKINYKEYTNQMIKIFDYAKNNGIYVNQLKNILKYLLYGKQKQYACKIVGEQVTFYPDGKQTFCTKLDTLDKNITIYNLKKNLPIINNKCENCIAKGICGGGCPWDNQFDENHFDKRMCYFNIEITNYILKDIYNEALKLHNNGEQDIELQLKKIYSKMLNK